MAIWIVVGGASNGGILVRAGQDLGSAQKPDRLSTGSRVREQQLIGERLHYELLEGKGPATGWVSTRLKDKDLLVKLENDVASQWEVPVPVAPVAAEPPPAIVNSRFGGTGRSQDLVQAVMGQHVRERCEACGIQIDRLEDRDAAPRLLEQIEKLESMSASAIKAEIKKRGFAFPASGKAMDQAVRLRDMLVWEQFRRAELHQECRAFGLPVQGGESHAALMQIISNATWELRGVPVWRLPSNLVGYGVLEQIDSLETRSLESLAAQCRKRGLPVEDALDDKEMLIQRMTLAIVWKVLPMHELRRECEMRGVVVDDLDLCEETESAAAHLRWSDNGQEQDVRPVLLQRLVEHMCASSPASRSDQVVAAPATASAPVAQRREQQAAAALGRDRAEQTQPAKDLGAEQRNHDVQEISSAAAAMKDYMKAVGGKTFWTGRPSAGDGPAAPPQQLRAPPGPRMPPTRPIVAVPGSGESRSGPSKVRALQSAPLPVALALQKVGGQRPQVSPAAAQSLGGQRPKVSAVGKSKKGPKSRNGTTILLARHGERLDDYEAAFRGRAWVPTAKTPWDPPLTDVGRKQAAALGQAALEHLERLKLPPLSRVFASPYVRCFGTAVEVALEAGLPSVCIEPSLSESFCEYFYRSWCVPNANGNWGGPEGCSIGVPVPQGKIMPEARLHAGTLLPPERLDHDLPEAVVKADQSYKPFLPLEDITYQWDNFETDEQLSTRMRSFFDYVACVYPGESVMLVSHSGPLQSLFTSVMPTLPSPLPFYCGLYVIHQPEGGDGSWTAPVVADTEHMQQWASRYANVGRPKATGKIATQKLSAAVRRRA